MSSYVPHPIDTTDVELPRQLDELSEIIARNVHEVWAAHRMAEGWTCGPERSDADRRHPCLVPYEELPETEKDYDRHTARETLRLIVRMGFRIVRETPQETHD